MKNQFINEIKLSTSKPAYKILKSKYSKSYFYYTTENSKYGGGQVRLGERYFSAYYSKFFGSKDRTAHILADKIVMKHEDVWLIASFVPQDNWDMDALQREIDAQQAEMDKEIVFLKPIAEARNEKEGAIIKASDAEKAAAKDAQQKEIYAYKNKTLAERAAYSAGERAVVNYHLRDKGQRFYLVKDMAGDYFMYNEATKACIIYFKYTQDRYEGYTLENKFLGSFAVTGNQSGSFGPERKPHRRVQLNSSGMPRLYPENEFDEKKYIGKITDEYRVYVFDKEVYEVSGRDNHQNLYFLYYIFFMQ